MRVKIGKGFHTYQSSQMLSGVKENGFLKTFPSAYLHKHGLPKAVGSSVDASGRTRTPQYKLFWPDFISTASLISATSLRPDVLISQFVFRFGLQSSLCSLCNPISAHRFDNHLRMLDARGAYGWLKRLSTCK
ncbi:hypothetical protein MRB53_023025 [Persea americana]|uniref:Uncharacterized protein n=1 Tax=Persea americana TaxID=3435 RepID=A0ACC2L9C2_PERAE|nr:hypothetical protein MRB53_023025 [Persea americana]